MISRTALPAPKLVASRAPADLDVGSGGASALADGPRVGAKGRTVVAAYLADLKGRLKSSWRPKEVYHRMDPQGRLQGSVLVTRLEVRLRADGTVEKAELYASSGVAALDTEARAALERMERLPRLPAEMVDARGGYVVRCSFHLNVGLYRFGNEVHRAIAEGWRPSKAFAVTSENERVTVIRLTLTKDGALTKAEVATSAGIDFLDQGALTSVKPGMRLPPPPPVFTRVPGPIPVMVAFFHRAGRLHVLKPREELEDD